MLRSFLAFCITLSAVIYCGEHACRGDEAVRPNVLLISVDDLRPVLGCYGNEVVRTPHLDRFAENAVVFRRAYCQVASCCPSRTSLLTGLRPETTGVYTNGGPHFREQLPDCVTLPQRFRQAGWFTMELGKVFHRRDPASWSVPKWIPETEYAYPIYGDPELRAQQRETRVTAKQGDWWGYERWIKTVSREAADVDDDFLFDGQLARHAAQVIAERRDEPFFLAVGFFRPHLPFIAPQKYFDLYPLESLKLPTNREAPEQAVSLGLHNSPESRSYSDIPRNGPFSEQLQLEILQAYYACVSYVDAQIGLLLKQLEEQKVADRTIVVLWSDHGYHFGEHGMWNKYTNFEEATRSTLIVHVPQQLLSHQAGVKTDGIVELLDVYPTLTELAGIEAPSAIEGSSLVPLLQDPKLPGKSGAHSRVQSGGAIGDAVRTERYRYVEWRRGKEIVARELYDHEQDPGENNNVADDVANRDVIEKLSKLVGGDS